MSRAGNLCSIIFGLLVIFFVIVTPWLAFGGPWVTYSLDKDRMDDNITTNSTTYSDFFLQYPILQFDRQQYLSKLCFTEINADLWLAVFRKDPQVSCTSSSSRRSSSYGRRTCRLVYCLSDWDVMANNRTKFVTNIKFLANPSYYLTVTDACWFAWWLPAAAMLYCGIQIAFPLVYTIFVFAVRVSLSVASMVKFLDYNALTDPPYTGYLNTNPIVQYYTSWKYDWGFAFGWIELIANGVAFLILVVAGIVCVCSAEHKEKLDSYIENWGSKSRRVRSRFTSHSNKTGVVNAGADVRSAKPPPPPHTAAAAADPEPNANSEPL